jgi:hypothetical protein
MHYTVQFLDASATVIEEWHADADDVAGAIALVEGVSGRSTRRRCEFSTGESGRLGAARRNGSYSRSEPLSLGGHFDIRQEPHRVAYLQ